MLQLAGKLAARVARGEVLYLHCWGGHGRTGTVISIMLHLMYDLTADAAMERCQHVHDVRRIPINVGSPQTDAQREQVRRVIWRLGRRSRAAAAAAAAVAVAAPRPCDVAGESANGAACGGGGASGLLSEDKQVVGAGSSGRGSRAAAVGGVGGRRGWVRGRRQAFAQAPNGVGEHVSGWLPVGDGEAEEQAQEQQGKGKGAMVEQDLTTVSESSAASPEDHFGSSSGGPSCGRTLRSRTCALRENEAGVSTAAGAGASGGVAVEAGPATSVPRRKSFNEPYSEEDPSRGTRIIRLRRKSAPSKPLPDVVAAAKRGAAAAAAALGKEDDADAAFASTVSGDAAAALSSPLKRGSAALGDGGGRSDADVSVASPGSCTGIERCVTRSSGAGSMGAGHHSAACGGRGGGSSVRSR